MLIPSSELFSLHCVMVIKPHPYLWQAQQEQNPTCLTNHLTQPVLVYRINNPLTAPMQPLREFNPSTDHHIDLYQLPHMTLSLHTYTRLTDTYIQNEPKLGHWHLGEGIVWEPTVQNKNTGTVKVTSTNWLEVTALKGSFKMSSFAETTCWVCCTKERLVITK